MFYRRLAFFTLHQNGWVGIWGGYGTQKCTLSTESFEAFDESIELDHLTALLRSVFDTEEMVPLAGARRLHRQLLGIDKPGDASD